MRFCPFCAQENTDEARECAHCGKRLPAPRPAPPRPVPQRPTPAPPSRAASPGLLDRQVRRPASAERAPSRPAPVEHAPSRPGPVAALRPPAEQTAITPPPEMPQPVAAPPRAASGTLFGMPVPAVTANKPPDTQPGLGDGTIQRPMAQAEADSGRRATRPISVPPPLAAGPEAAADDSEPPETFEEGPTVRSASPLKTDPHPLVLGSRPATVNGKHPGLLPTVPAGSLFHPAAASDPGADTLDEEPQQPSDAFHPMDLSATPYMPTLALPAMPLHPRSGSVLEAVRYVYVVARAVWARKKAQESIRSLLHADQRLLDGVLRELGRAAREAELEAPSIAEEMRSVHDQEGRRLRAKEAASQAEAERERETERWRVDDGQREIDITRREGEIDTADKELEQQHAARRQAAAELEQLEAKIRAAEKMATQADARAVKAEASPPEKGGGPNSVANARMQAEAARKAAAEVMPTRDEAKSRVQALDGPIATLEQRLADERAALAERKREREEAAAAHQQALARIEEERRRAQSEHDGADREISQRFVSVGTILNLNRIEGDRFAPLYGRIDELKAGVTAREAAITRLANERRAYDRSAVQKGLVTVGIALGALVLLAILLAILHSR